MVAATAPVPAAPATPAATPGAGASPAKSHAGTDIHLTRSTQPAALDVDEALPYEYLAAAAALSGKPPPERAPRSQLLETHARHVKQQRRQLAKLQEGLKDGTKAKPPRQVKKPILALAYPASTKGMGELEPVRHCSLLASSMYADFLSGNQS